MTMEEKASRLARQLEELEKACRACRDTLEKMAEEKAQEYGDNEDTAQKELKERIVDLKISYHAFNSLGRAGCVTVGDLIRKYPRCKQAIKIRGFGRKSMAEVSEALQAIGVKWPVDMVTK